MPPVGKGVGQLDQDELLEMWDSQNFHPIAPLE